MYSPTLGRFLQTDPIGTTDDLNLYAYVKNNPVNFTDPTGLIASLSGNFASTTAAPAVAPKLDAPAFSMPTAAAGDAIQVAGAGGDRMGGNQAENKQFQDVVVKLRLTPGQAQELHREISKQGMGYHEILQVGKDMFVNRE